ncbi:MAG: GntR family transcriptional regulator [Candidatus Obscuribacterales bacterium]|nr:GntR family transcriptional regulator [Candidatus Obscuribacterales bacterium]
MVLKKQINRRQSTRDYIKETLLERILGGHYQPGERLIELQIAEELGTSQGPVREALRDLEAQGLVESQSYKGTRVREISEEEIEDSYQVRSVLEQLAAELAAPKLKNNTDSIKQELDAFRQAASKRDIKRYSQHDMEFHRQIVEAAGNQLLSELWNSVVLESRFLATIKQRIGEEDLQRLADAHLPILEALHAGESEKAGRLARQLICTFHSKRK